MSDRIEDKNVTPVPQDKLEEWRRLADAATPGEWRTETISVFAGDEDAEFIAAARIAVPALLDHIEFKQEEHADFRRTTHENYDALWALIYDPKKDGDWDYPGQIIAHMRIFIREKDEEIAALKSQLAIKNNPVDLNQFTDNGQLDARWNGEQS